MPDISLCTNNKCPSRLSCYRFTAKPNEMWQVYGDFKFPEGEDKCEYYWNNGGYEKREDAETK